MHRRRTSGLTILELAVAFAVLAILVAVARPLYRGYRERALVRQTVSDMENISMRIGAFRFEFGQLPAAIDNLIDPMPRDPWGNDYQYLVLEGAPPSVRGQARKDRNLVPINSDYDLYSMGPDGQSRPPLAALVSLDDIVRANDGRYIGRASDY